MKHRTYLPPDGSVLIDRKLVDRFVEAMAHVGLGHEVFPNTEGRDLAVRALRYLFELPEPDSADADRDLTESPPANRHTDINPTSDAIVVRAGPDDTDSHSMATCKSRFGNDALLPFIHFNFARSDGEPATRMIDDADLDHVRTKVRFPTHGA